MPISIYVRHLMVGLPSAKISHAALWVFLSPDDALKHFFTSLKTQIISLQLRVLGGKSP